MVEESEKMMKVVRREEMMEEMMRFSREVEIGGKKGKKKKK